MKAKSGKLKAKSPVNQPSLQLRDFELSPALEGKFELRNTHLPRLHVGGKWYDLRTISMAEAEEIVAKSDTFLYRTAE